jgi:hypothetical protein
MAMLALEPPPGTDPFAYVAIEYVSPSTLETFAACPRKWGWHKLDRLPKPQNKGAGFGDRVHKQHEGWLAFGRPYDLTTHEGEVARS